MWYILKVTQAMMQMRGWLYYLHDIQFKIFCLILSILFYFQAYKSDSTNLSVIEWLGAYYIESQFCEKAIPYFERASVIQWVWS
jgi:hypothetical protein